MRDTTPMWQATPHPSTSVHQLYFTSLREKGSLRGALHSALRAP